MLSYRNTDPPKRALNVSKLANIEITTIHGTRASFVCFEMNVVLAEMNVALCVPYLFNIMFGEQSHRKHCTPYTTQSGQQFRDVRVDFIIFRCGSHSLTLDLTDQFAYSTEYGCIVMGGGGE